MKNCTFVCFSPVQDQNDGMKKRIKAPFPHKRDLIEREERHTRRTSHPLANFLHLFIGVPFFELKLVFFMIIDNSCLYRKLTLISYSYGLLCWLFYDQELTDLLIYNNKPRT